MARISATPIVALDVSSADDAWAIVESLGDRCAFYKVGSELFTAAGPSIVERITGLGRQVFLDLKLHDIPNTVKGAARSAARLGASLLTVHASGGEAMIRAAVDGAGSGCGILAVTVLTSMNSETLSSAWGRVDRVDVKAEVMRLASLAAQAGAHGVVCSGEESPLVHARFGDTLATLVPGIRFADGARHDQARVVTPGSAAAGGARYLVLGRAVTGDPDPRAAMERVWGEIGAVTAT